MAESLRPKFAVVREDPDVEHALVRRTRAKRVLVVASGGCTALTLVHREPELEVTAYDFAEAQLAQVRDKQAAVARGDLRALNREGRPVVAAFYTQCSQLAFALSRPEDPPVRCISEQTDDFDLWRGPFALPETGAFFVSDNRFDHDIEAL